MKKDIEWLKGEIKNFQEAENMFTGEFNAGVQDALEYVQELIDQLDEPEKPVIPQFVADWIESYRKKTLVELINDAVYSSSENSRCFRRWFHEKMGFESNYSEFIARSWLDGYEVEKEQKYQVIIRDGKYIRLFLCKHGDDVIIGTNDNYVEKCPEVAYLTEEEIKDYDERFWVFAKEVEE